MKKNEWIRARSDEQKEERITDIVSATERLYNKFGYEEITFVQIAKEAGFTRSNLYKYFKTKEEIFLEFLKQDIRVWKKYLLKNFNKGSYYSISDFAEIWVDTIQSNRRLIGLISILYEHLEKHASYEALLDFKQSFDTEITPMADHLSKQLKNFTFDKVFEFLNLQAALAIGLYQMTDLSKNQSKILEKPKYAHFKTDFTDTYTKSIKYAIEGILAK